VVYGQGGYAHPVACLFVQVKARFELGIEMAEGQKMASGCKSGSFIRDGGIEWNGFYRRP
ncbi:MAG TPA: hypothetical protein VGB38_00775, partial [bacterium]